MVDVSPKAPTKRTATASGRIYIPKIAYDLITPPDARATAAARFCSAGFSGATSQPQQGSEELAELEKAKAKAQSKGDVLTVAQLAAIMGCKRTSDLIPLCHPLQLSHISVRLLPEYHSFRTGLPSSASFTSASTPPNDDNEATSEDRSLEDRPRPSHYSVMCQATVSCEGKTGVEMEALTAVSVGLLTVWDMLKAVAGKEMVIGEIVVERKQGGKSGDFVRTHVRQ